MLRGIRRPESEEPPFNFQRGDSVDSTTSQDSLLRHFGGNFCTGPCADSGGPPYPSEIEEDLTTTAENPTRNIEDAESTTAADPRPGQKRGRDESIEDDTHAHDTFKRALSGGIQHPDSHATMDQATEYKEVEDKHGHKRQKTNSGDAVRSQIDSRVEPSESGATMGSPSTQEQRLRTFDTPTSGGDGASQSDMN